MRQKLLIPLLSVSALMSALPAAAQQSSPFTRPSVLQAKANAVNPGAPVQQAPTVAVAPVAPAPIALSPAQKEEEERKLREQKEAEEKAEEERKKKEAEAARRKKLGLKDGQDLVEREFKGARIGMVNGVNVYRGNDDTAGYFFETGDKRRYIRVLSEDSVDAEPKSNTGGAASGGAGRRGAQAQGEKAPDLPSSVGRPAPRGQK